ncbi:hypothetical protein LRHMDP2_2015 [Lacticaseibacillus rhamnosus LRHMDP2]|uniref:Uncharacterized protein n=1 Tax=Lacticaseibacillus rhamnosus LRHMDP3 TaxID=1203259 RepID=A0AB33XR23_LACRH|nr:hypothetical protein LRHMDP3_2719 [Lacticaseibacillus rhamnosus LRHMDP3]EKS50472.1 hypothetical protein LRHMDP2_2015 [Lacticaseibacillus rhamnosus LRHMDP2]
MWVFRVGFKGQAGGTAPDSAADTRPVFYKVRVDGMAKGYRVRFQQLTEYYFIYSLMMR